MLAILGHCMVEVLIGVRYAVKIEYVNTTEYMLKLSAVWINLEYSQWFYFIRLGVLGYGSCGGHVQQFVLTPLFSHKINLVT